MKKYSDNLLVSFSGGETSAFMAQWVLKHYKEIGYKDVAFVFANTGLEAEETLEFTDRCAKHFGFDLHWVEAKVSLVPGEGVRYDLVDFTTASRNGEPYESVIEKYGVPGPAAPHCTKNLKVYPINSFAKVAFDGQKYDSAIGIRYDEIDRQNENAAKQRLVYPLIHLRTTKPVVNVYWRDMPFRLNIPSYLGNCITCFKKGDRALFPAINERPESMDFWVRVMDRHSQNSRKSQVPFRKGRLPEEMIQQAANWNEMPIDARKNYNIQMDLYDAIDETESCEVYSHCGEN